MQPVLKNSYLVAGQYKVIRHIGSGGMSNVYEVEATHLGIRKALKEFWVGRYSDPQEKQNMIDLFAREAKILAKLRHDGIPIISDFFFEGQNYYIVMDLIDGESLEEILKKRSAIPVSEIVGWMIKVCDILAYLHGQNPPVLYRDLKPANIMLLPDGNIILVDFGISGWLKTNQPGATQQATVAMGSPGFAPPEQYSGKSDIQSDIFALGATTHYLLSGKNPESNPFQFDPLPILRSDVPKELEGLVRKMVNTTKSLRPKSIADVMKELLIIANPPASPTKQIQIPSVNFTRDPEFIRIMNEVEQQALLPEPQKILQKIRGFYSVGMLERTLDQTEKLLGGFLYDSRYNSLLDETHWLIAKLYESLGNFKKARAHYEKSIQADPTRQLAYQDLQRIETLLVQKKQQKKQTAQANWQSFWQWWIDQLHPENIAILLWGDRSYGTLVATAIGVILGFVTHPNICGFDLWGTACVVGGVACLLLLLWFVTLVINDPYYDIRSFVISFTLFFFTWFAYYANTDSSFYQTVKFGGAPIVIQSNGPRIDFRDGRISIHEFRSALKRIKLHELRPGKYIKKEKLTIFVHPALNW